MQNQGCKIIDLRSPVIRVDVGLGAATRAARSAAGASGHNPRTEADASEAGAEVEARKYDPRTGGSSRTIVVEAGARACNSSGGVGESLGEMCRARLRRCEHGSRFHRRVSKGKQV